MTNAHLQDIETASLLVQYSIVSEPGPSVHKCLTFLSDGTIVEKSPAPFLLGDFNYKRYFDQS